MIFAIDPGNEFSAYCVMTNDYQLQSFAKLPNKEVMEIMLKHLSEHQDTTVVIERMMSYSMSVGRTTFETCEWIGRFSQEAEKLCPVKYIYRKDEKMYLCGSMKANDTMIRRALIDRFAKFDFKFGRGTKSHKDFFYGVSHDVWSAIAIGCVFLDMECEKNA